MTPVSRMLMLDSSSCMLVRSEETHPWSADDALESIIAGSSFVCIYSSISIGIASGACNSLDSKHSKSPGFSSAKPWPGLPDSLQASDRDDERRTSRLPPDTHLTATPSTHLQHHSQCLSSARSSPSKLVSSRKRPREKERREGGGATMQPRRKRKDTFNERDQALTSTFQLQSSPCGPSTPPVRYSRIPPARPDEKRERARGGYTPLRERRAKAVPITGLVIAYGINSLATTLAACTFSPSLSLSRYWSPRGVDEEQGSLDEDMSGT